MAYKSSRLFAEHSSAAKITTWLYITDDSFTAVSAPNYFLDALSRGAKPGDPISVIVFTTSLPDGELTSYSSCNLAVFTGVTSSGGTIKGGALTLLTGVGGPDTHNANYTFISSDVGKLLRHTDGSNYTWTIDTYANQPIAAGQAIVGGCESTGTLTIAAPAGGSLIRSDGTAGTGNRTVGASSDFMLVKLDNANAWKISGSALS